MNPEAILALISLVLLVVSSSVSAIIFILKQLETTKDYLLSRIERNSEDCDKTESKLKEQFLHLLAQHENNERRIALLERLLKDVLMWAYKKGYFSTRAFSFYAPKEYCDRSNQEEIEDNIGEDEY